LLNQNIDANITYEIILVNNCSTDHSKSIVENIKNESSLSIKIIDAPLKKSPGYARNQGLLKANGKWIGLLDSDDFLDKDYVQSMYRSLQEKHILKSSISLVNNASSKPIFKENRKKRIENQGSNLPQLFTCHLFVEKIELMNVFGWDESLLAGEDYELGYRLLMNGLKIKNVELAIYHPSSKNSVMSILKKAKRYANFDVIIHRKYFAYFPSNFFITHQNNLRPFWKKFPKLCYHTFKRFVKRQHVVVMLVQSLANGYN
jgi:glycosyltransferase involved in cell wall biosynthesis